MNKKLTDREQKIRDHKKVLSRFMRAKLPSTKERLIPELDAALERIPPDSKREKILAAINRSPAAIQMDIVGRKPAILHALTKGNVELFFRDVEFFPDLFADTDIMDSTLVVWMLNKFLKNARGDVARKNLKRLAKILTNIHGAPAYETKEERDAANRENRNAATKRYRKTSRKKRTLKGAS
jgi:hypothetical protein